ncbi:protein Dr1-like, partial [Penaeus monodon]|uniref:protein Dr1-like n=1 Tax=Penaeus monodon TaxID=6687 RepID=UPI0018A7937D
CNQKQKKKINAEHILMVSHLLWFFDYRADAEAVLKDCKAMAAKKRRKSTRLENLGIPEEELLRQQQELFAKAREQVEMVEQQQWQMLQAQAAAAQQQQQEQQAIDEDEDYS